MKANLTIENIGSHRGVRNYEINSGKITIFEGANSSGKSTIIKSIATILSSPINSKNLHNEANKFGILPMDNKDSPLVNIFENEASISLSYEELNLKANILKNGTISTTFPKNFRGNENFLYACMLLKNSKIQRFLASGDDNFQWIVSEMSYASKYEDLNETNLSYLRLNNAAKNTLKDINKNIGKYISEIKDSREKKKEFSEELEKVQKEIKNLPKSENPELNALEEQQNELMEKKDISKDRSEGLNEQFQEIGKKLNNFSSNFENINIEIEKLKIEIKEYTDEIEFIKKIDTVVEDSKIMENQEEVKKLIGELSSNKTLRELHNTILNSRHESDTCPLCNSKIPTNKEKSSNELKKIRKKIESLSKIRNDIEIEIQRSVNLKKRAGTLKINEGRLRTKRKTIDSKTKQKEGFGNQTNELKNDLRSKEDNISREKKLLESYIKNIDEIEKKIEIIIKEDKEKSEIYQKRKFLMSSIQKLDINIETNNKLIQEKSQLELFGMKIPIEKADQIINNLSIQFEEIELYLYEKMIEQRNGAAKKFNSTINNVIEELKLEDFEDIYIDLEDYRLIVVRNGGKVQPLGALGGAERGIIGGILQISCKQTYLKDIPFFIGDDIILEFDPDMSETFMNYLKKLAVEDDLFIIITKISNSRQLKQLEI